EIVMGRLFPVLIALVCLALIVSPTPAAAGGSCKTFIRNGTTQTAYFWVDNGGRGLTANIPTEDGRSAQRVEPNEVACASETNFFDFPTLRVYNAAGKCIYAKEVKYVPVAGDPNK